MLLRTRVTLIVTVSFSLLVAGLTFAGLKSEELADERFAQATLNGQEIFWKKLVENTVQRLEADARAITAIPELGPAVTHRDPTTVLSLITPAVEPMRRQGRVSRVEVVNRDGELLYSSRGSLLDPPTIDAGTVKTIIEEKAAVRGVLQDASRTFTATLAVPLDQNGEVIGVVVLAADMQPPLAEFKASTGSDIFLVDRVAQLALGTNDALWKTFEGRISVRKSRLETWQQGKIFYSVAVLPVFDGSHRVIGALVTARDVTETQARQQQIRYVAIGSVAAFLVLLLGMFTVYLRRSFHPLEEAIAVLNALSRGDTSVTLEVGNDKDEIGRIAGTVGVFRENVIQLELLQQRRERQRRRQELYIRLQMLKMSEMLEEEARAAVLADLKQIEALASRDPAHEGAEDSGKGELEVLGVAFQTMSDRIREQHISLQELIAQRTKEAEVLREALRTREQLDALRQELDFARELQLSSLPQVFPPFPDRTEFQIHAGMVPAKEVGGDFYDFFLIDHHHLGFVIGDASGKGVPAAMFISIARSLIKAVAPLSSSPGECLAFVNTMLSVDNPQTLFATCFYGVLDTRSGEVAFCNAGHPPAMILRPTGQVDAIRDVSGVALGVMEDLEYETGTFQLNPGDVILLYTDGVTEAQNVASELYDEPRLLELFGTLGGKAPHDVLLEVQRVVEQFQGEAPQFDDITMLVLQLDGLSETNGAVEAPHRRLMLTGFQPEPSEAPAIPAPPASAAPTVAPVPEPEPTPVPVQPGPVAPPAPPKLVVRPQPAAPKTAPQTAKVVVQPKVVVKSQPKPAAPAAPKLVVKTRPVVTPPPTVGAKPTIVVKPRVQVTQAPVTTAPPTPPPANPNALAVTIANDLGELERLAGLVDQYVEKLGLEERIAFNLNLCLDELITNIISYGYSDDHHHDIHVRFALDNGVLMTEIIDDGAEYNPFTEAPEPDLDLEVDDRPIGGLGVFLVKEFMDRTDYRRDNGTNIVTLWKGVAEQES
jgi:sigma-B regulation protein RsbU (phosphoserine phosphatase)